MTSLGLQIGDKDYAVGHEKLHDRCSQHEAEVQGVTPEKLEKHRCDFSHLATFSGCKVGLKIAFLCVKNYFISLVPMNIIRIKFVSKFHTDF